MGPLREIVSPRGITTGVIGGFEGGAVSHVEPDRPYIEEALVTKEWVHPTVRRGHYLSWENGSFRDRYPSRVKASTENSGALTITTAVARHSQNLG